jgi:hypothetical protein
MPPVTPNMFRRIIEWLYNDELEGMQKEAVVD